MRRLGLAFLVGVVVGAIAMFAFLVIEHSGGDPPGRYELDPTEPGGGW